jgi:murein DD-endopeptidase MepM/ murein hydrolase activator NlpD
MKFTGTLFLIHILFAFLPAGTIAQIFPDTDYPKGYFRNPLDVPISLSGNFGELRPNHYHMGLDLKTLQRENLRVYAAAEGYIARVKVEPGGFGRAIYINHPNGYTTLYAHLNDFTPSLEAYVKEQQYKLESWAVYLELPPGLFPVRKGDFIAYSGNTGGSQAPHVHFEIRKTASDVNVNPMLFGLPVPDNTKPAVLRLAIYDRNKSVYEQSPRIIPIKRGGSGYITTPLQITSASNRISFGISAYDTHTGSSNQNGIYETIVYEDEKPVSGFRMDNISYDATRFLNAHIDFRTRALGGPYVQHLSPLPGYINSIYASVNDDGVLDLSDGEVRRMRVTVKDAYGNASELKFNIVHSGQGAQPAPQPGRVFYPFMLDVFESENCEFYLGENCLYDSVRISYRETASANPVVVSNVHTLGAAHIPLHDYFMVRIKANAALDETEKQRVVMQRFAGSKKNVFKVDWQNEWASAKFRDFGSFQLVLDKTPPQIIPIGFADGSDISRATRLSITVKDNLDAFKNFRAELDGKWLRFTNDKGRTFHYRFDERFPRGEHELKVTVEDEAGNVTTEVYHLKR